MGEGNLVEASFTGFLEDRFSSVPGTGETEGFFFIA
jgi:hypothetical protein